VIVDVDDEFFSVTSLLEDWMGREGKAAGGIPITLDEY